MRQVRRRRISMATSSFQKNFTVSRKGQEQLASVMTCKSLGATMSKNFNSKFSKVDDYKTQLSEILKVKK